MSSKSKDSDDELIGQKRMAFLDLLIEVSEDGKILSDEDIREEVILYYYAQPNL
jgi:cytochrome P450 family 4